MYSVEPSGFMFAGCPACRPMTSRSTKKEPATQDAGIRGLVVLESWPTHLLKAKDALQNPERMFHFARTLAFTRFFAFCISSIKFLYLTLRLVISCARGDRLPDGFSLPLIRAVAHTLRFSPCSSGSRLIYVVARLPGQLAFGFFAVASGKAAFLVNRTPVFIGPAAFNINPLSAD
jgi:hypothetical protein